MSTILDRLGRGTARRPWVVVGAWLLLTVLVVAASGAFGARYEDSFRVPGLDSQRANELLAAAGGGQQGLTAQVVVTPSDEDATFFSSASARSQLAELQAEAAALPHVLGTTDPAGAAVAGPAATPGGTLSADGRVALLRLQYPELDALGAQDLERLKAIGAGLTDLRVEKGGDLFFAFETTGGNLAELVGVLVAAVILFVAFGSLLAAALPIGVAVVGLAIGTSAMTLLARGIDVPSYAPVLGAMVGLGVGIDYALFVVSRHREQLGRGMGVPESIGRALATAGRPVVFAGGIVVVSILGMAVARVPFMTAGGIAIAIVVLVMVAASVTLLPALLALAGTRLVRGRRAGRLARPVSPGWTRWVTHVTRHPVAYVVGATALLLALAAPVTALRIGIPDDGALPEGWTQREAYDLVSDGFGPGANGPLVVAVDLHGDRAVLAPLAAALAADPGVASVGAPAVSAAADVASLVVVPTTGPQDEATADTVTRLRELVLPAATAGSAASAHVGGQTASFADVGARVNERLPLFVLAVLAMSFVLLVLVFRSVLVPLKAVVLNLLGIGASYGVMVMVFQWGWGADLIGVESTVPIVSFIPMFMFAILFGLSMDYEVFLLSRVREDYTRTHDERGSVVRGVAGSARVITSAAAIMVAVFGSFVLGADSATKMFGVGLATAVLLDATVVRMVLVPATMRLLGRANWWLPGWLDRRLPHVELGHDEPSHDERARRPVAVGRP